LEFVPSQFKPYPILPRLLTNAIARICFITLFVPVQRPQHHLMRSSNGIQHLGHSPCVSAMRVAMSIDFTG
jgi:hypothetical protein